MRLYIFIEVMFIGGGLEKRAKDARTTNNGQQNGTCRETAGSSCR